MRLVCRRCHKLCCRESPLLLQVWLFLCEEERNGEGKLPYHMASWLAAQPVAWQEEMRGSTQACRGFAWQPQCCMSLNLPGFSCFFFFLLCCLLGLSPKPPLFSNLSILAGWKMITCMRKHRQKVKTSLVRTQTKLLYARSDTNTRASTTPKRNGGGESHSQVQKEIQGNWE